MSAESVAQLVRTVDELRVLLERDNAELWADWTAKVAKELRASDYHGIERLLSAYGGMGSFNDFVPNDSSLAERISILSQDAFRLATEIRRSEARTK